MVPLDQIYQQVAAMNNGHYSFRLKIFEGGTENYDIGLNECMPPQNGVFTQKKLDQM